MTREIEITPEIAECVGLWLAEGDNKSLYEVTFTNNCFHLVEFFASTINELFKSYEIKPRLYVYSSKKVCIKFPLAYKINYYEDKRARKPYFIYRISSVIVVKKWKSLVEEMKQNNTFYLSILRGFFAGEGNIKIGSHSNKTCRIAQGKPNKFIEKILHYLDITFKFSYNDRSYDITGKWNMDVIAEKKIADLHPLKKEKFWSMYNSYKELHYPDHWLKNNILNVLDEPYSSLKLASRFNRSQARIQDILIPLKKEGIIQRFGVRSKSYWIKTEKNKLIISKRKEKYLHSLKQNKKTTAEIAKDICVCWKAAYRRLLELQKLNLVKIDTNGYWKRIPTRKEVIII